MLRHKVSEYGIDVDRAKIEVIELSPPTNVKGIHSLLGQCGVLQVLYQIPQKCAVALPSIIIRYSTPPSCPVAARVGRNGRQAGRLLAEARHASGICLYR